MGCFNYTCFLTNHAVRYKDEVAVILVNESYGGGGARRFFDPAPFLLYGTYNDYGGVDGCHGSQLNRLKRTIKNHVVPVEPERGFQEERGVSKTEVSMKTLFRASHRDELRLATPATFKAALGGLVDPHTRLTHIMILQSALDKLLDQYTYDVNIFDEDEKYSGNKSIGYQDVIDSIPAYIKLLHEYYSRDNSFHIRFSTVPESSELRGKDLYIGEMLLHEFNDSNYFWHLELRNAIENHFMSDREEPRTDDDLVELLTEFAKRAIIESYVHYSNGVFIPLNSSSQDGSWDAQVLMADITKEVADERQAQWDAENLPEDSWDEKRQVHIEQCEIEF